MEVALAPLTRRQQQILDYIKSVVDEYHYPPTVREIGDQFKITSPNGVMSNLKALQKKGYIDWTPNLSRSIVVHGRRERCPHCGKTLGNHS